jgi:hypothetical protein
VKFLGKDLDQLGDRNRRGLYLVDAFDDAWIHIG